MKEVNRVFPMIQLVYDERETKSWAEVFNKRIDKVFTVSSNFIDDAEAYWISQAVLHDKQKYRRLNCTWTIQTLASNQSSNIYLNFRFDIDGELTGRLNLVNKTLLYIQEPADWKAIADEAKEFLNAVNEANPYGLSSLQIENKGLKKN